MPIADSRREQFLKLVTDVKTQTSREEIIKRMRSKLISKITTKLGIEKIIFALNCSKLTIDLLSNVAMGKGAHIATEMALEEQHNNLTYIRPLREVTSKEIYFYNHYTNLDDLVISSNSSLLVKSKTYLQLKLKFLNA